MDETENEATFSYQINSQMHQSKKQGDSEDNSSPNPQYPTSGIMTHLWVGLNTKGGSYNTLIKNYDLELW